MVEQSQPNEKNYIKGELIYIIFQNQEEHFSIAKITVKETNTSLKEKEIVIKGYFSNLQDNTSYLFYGQFENHVKFGMQFAVNAYQTYIPDTKEGLIAYLSSDLFYGVGKKTAERIIDQLGEAAISRMINEPGVLDGVKGLKKETADALVETLKENQGFEHVVVYLSKYNIGLKMAQKIYQEYKEETIELLNDDPYQFVFDIEGFGFQTADHIARQNGLSMSHPNRIGAGCIYILQKSIQQGHVYLPIDQCIPRVTQLLSHPEYAIDDQQVSHIIEELNKSKSIIVQDGRVYLPSLYYAEDGFVSHLQRLLEQPTDVSIPIAELMKITGEIEEDEILNYGKEQFEAINQALHSKVMILTGGPGTGKTTVIKGILNAYGSFQNISIDPEDYEDKSEFPFILTAPTGRAAKRLTESTGLLAVTIHRLLGWNGNNGFDKDEHNQLSGKFIIVDEFSMVDIWLANHLFKALPDDIQVLLVGDEDQLPSVGPGQVLTDLLEAEAIPYVTLQEVYRQKEGSKIIQLAHEIKNNECRLESLEKDKDFSFIACRDYHMTDVLTQIFQQADKKGIHIKDIQVLAPMYRGPVGINTINRELQQLINPKTRQKREVIFNQDTHFRVGDKVIQLVNQPEDHVFNGDIGEIAAIFTEDENTDNVEQLVVAFEEREVVYERKDYVNIMHAYCISIHKAQGSEFPIIVMPIYSAYRRMLRKNLLYTGLTRAQQSLIIFGEKQTFLNGVQTLDTNKRYTSLREQLAVRMKELPTDINGEVLDDDELSPYDFL